MIVDHTKIGAAFRRLSLPVAVQMLGDQLLGVVDTIAIGSLGAVALAGATAATTLVSTFVFGFFGLLSGIVDRRGAAHRRATISTAIARTVRAGASMPFACAVVICLLRELRLRPAPCDALDDRRACQRPCGRDLFRFAVFFDAAD